MKSCAVCPRPIADGENYYKVDEAFLHTGDCYSSYKSRNRLSWPAAVFLILFPRIAACHGGLG
jgi:hypothetical protein